MRNIKNFLSLTGDRGKLLHWTCLPNGVRMFTKIVKPVYATLRRKRQLNVGYVDYSYLYGDQINECQSNETDTWCCYTRLGFCFSLCEISA